VEAKRLEGLRVVGRHRSAHFAGASDAELLAEPATPAYPTTRAAQDYPAGTILAERIVDDGGSKVSAYLVMHKREPTYNPAGCDWEYLTLTADRLVVEEGSHPLCSRCHAEASHHCVFGLAR
jgi:hypothetical protein